MKTIRTYSATEDAVLETLRQQGSIPFNEAVKTPLLLNTLRALCKRKDAPVFFSGSTLRYHLSLVACVTVH